MPHNIVLKAAKSGLLTLIYRGAYLYSGYDPEKSVLRLLPPPEENVLYLLASPLLGHGLKIWLKTLPASSHLLFYEAEPELQPLTMKAAADWQTAQTTLLETVSETDIEQALVALTDRYSFYKCILLTPTGGYQLNKKIYDETAASLHRSIKIKAANEKLLYRNSRRWNKNIISNIRHLKTSWRPVFPDKPVLLVGAGLSVDNALPLILKNRAKAVIICVDTALPPLIENGIIPDAVIIVEGGFYNTLDFVGHKDCGVPVIADLSSYPPLLNSLPAHKSFFISRIFPASFFTRLSTAFSLPLLPALGSVATAALAYVLMHSRSAVILCGFDFCYRYERSHAKSCYTHKIDLYSHTRLNQMPVTRLNLQKDTVTYNKLITDSTLLRYYSILHTARHKNIYKLPFEGLPLSFPLFNFEHAAVRPGHIRWEPVESSVKNFILHEMTLIDQALKELKLTAETDYLRYDKKLKQETALPLYMHFWNQLLKNC
jgi:hypothetical protein